MKFNISGFTNKGTGKYVSNEDNILVNGALINEGEILLTENEKCLCFVSDGVGGNNAGGFASAFVLSELLKLVPENFKDISGILYNTNSQLLAVSESDNSKKGCACTLSGMIAFDDFVDFIQVGDSEIWLLRNDMLLKISSDEVSDENKTNSPLINYFGGNNNILKINTDWVKPELLKNDIFLLCSDGLFKSLNIKIVKSILTSSRSLYEKIIKIKENCLAFGSDDNISAVAVEFLGI
ncbi:MAG TPA: protein phosphatase 2C domain-containing protein [Bacteroidales bacterium]|nr:protein phosphatase 2C domain-containing protein [Bacteroidales bacterium]